MKQNVNKFLGGIWKQFWRAFPNQLIVTLGSAGARYYDGEKHVIVEGVQDEVVDTTGAGIHSMVRLLMQLLRALNYWKRLSLPMQRHLYLLKNSGHRVACHHERMLNVDLGLCNAEP